MKPGKEQISGSIVESFDQQVKKWIEEGISATVIHRNLRHRYGFEGSYQNVKPMQPDSKRRKVTIILDLKPGEAVQVDFGTGPVFDGHQDRRIFEDLVFCHDPGLQQTPVPGVCFEPEGRDLAWKSP